MLVMNGVTDRTPPKFERSYADGCLERGMRSLGFENGQYRIDAMAEDHYRAIGEAHIGGRYVIGAAHAYAPGEVVIAHYHASGQDEYRQTAWSILNSFCPADWIPDDLDRSHL